MNDFEDRVRRALHADGPGADPERLLGDVRRGAARLRRRRVALAVTASVLAIVAAVGVATQVGAHRSAGTAPVPARTPSPAPTQPPLPAGATRGVVDVSVVSADRWFRLTVNDGCAACSTVWQNDQSAEGGWERLHDFGATTADGEPADPRSGPVEHLVMAADGRNGWAWGQRTFSTHDGGRTWTAVLPSGNAADHVQMMGLTGHDAWALVRSAEHGTSLFRTSIGDDGWETPPTDPGSAAASDLITVGDAVALVVSVPQAGVTPYLLVSKDDGATWGRLDNPCHEENQVLPIRSAAFILCFDLSSEPNRGVVYRSTDLTSWKAFGSTPGNSFGMRPLADDAVLMTRPGKPALLMSPDRSTNVDLGLRKGEDLFCASCVGDRCLFATLDHRLITTSDRGRTWQPVE